MDNVYKELANLNYIVKIDNGEDGSEKYTLQRSLDGQLDQFELPTYQTHTPVIDRDDLPETLAVDYDDIIKELSVDTLPQDSSGLEISQSSEPTTLEELVTKLQYDNITPPMTPDYTMNDNPTRYPQTSTIRFPYYGNIPHPEYEQFPQPTTIGFPYYGNMPYPEHEQFPGYPPYPYTAQPLYSPIYVPYPTKLLPCYMPPDYHLPDSQHISVRTIPTPEPSPEIVSSPVKNTPTALSIIENQSQVDRDSHRTKDKQAITGSTIPKQKSAPAASSKHRHTSAICSMPTLKPSLKGKKTYVQYDGNFYCTLCDRNFGRQSSLTQHNINRHSGPRQYRCAQCGKRYQFPKELETHEQRHRALKKPFPCSKCPKQFYHRMDLERHHSKHHGQVPFRCSECGKGFARGDHLSAHLVSHKNKMIKYGKVLPLIDNIEA
ncbi:zinc finger protein 69 homolog [Topomyia yanbarensis]|uniref:zinc finger protein 69 homolog n=1 Tax=Topomyia yanbarensis TaxID=2498891 RepID=UPI00273BEB78|nr:zinc finger protein 69 homolog [Topomyia yanbarensis]XP_058822757.1 zinc finger protein 69 homolog [Topomyia yanbarensis]XP_058822758.1 zinc finger protein 69 homolog [Topomyia yanbarensis]